MAWTDDMVVMLRVLISDNGDNCQYTDSRLQQLLVVAAQLVKQEIDFTTTYTVSIGDFTISPDPTLSASKDDAFTNFVVIKAACLTDWSTFRTKALVAGVKARCGPAVLETLQHLDGFKELLSKGPCATYESMKKQWLFGNATFCKAILTPFVGNKFDPHSLGGPGGYWGYDPRAR